MCAPTDVISKIEISQSDRAISKRVSAGSGRARREGGAIVRQRLGRIESPVLKRTWNIPECSQLIVGIATFGVFERVLAMPHSLGAWPRVNHVAPRCEEFHVAVYVHIGPVSAYDNASSRLSTFGVQR